MMTDVAHPVYPAARAVISRRLFAEALRAVSSVPNVFCDSDSVLVPESEVEVIEMLRTRFGALIEYGCGKENEFIYKACMAGLPADIMIHGSMVAEHLPQSNDEMVRRALEDPDACLREWHALYLEILRGS